MINTPGTWTHLVLSEVNSWVQTYLQSRGSDFWHGHWANLEGEQRTIYSVLHIFRYYTEYNVYKAVYIISFAFIKVLGSVSVKKLFIFQSFTGFHSAARHTGSCPVCLHCGGHREMMISVPYRLRCSASYTPPCCCTGCCCRDNHHKWMIGRCRCLGRSRTWRSQRGRDRCQVSPYSDLQRHSNHLLELTGFLPKLDVYWLSLYLRTSVFCRNFINASFLGGGKHSDCRRREESFNTDTQRQTGAFTHLYRCKQVSTNLHMYRHVYYSSVQRQVCYLFLHLQTDAVLTCTSIDKCSTHLSR